MSGDEKQQTVDGQHGAPGAGGVSPPLGPDESLAKWFESLAAPLWRRAVGRFRCSEAEADDLVADVFVRAGKAARAGNPPRRSSWFYKAMRNLWINEIRRPKLFESLELLCAGGFEPHAAGPGPREALLRREAVEAVHACLEALPPDQRRVIELTGLGGLPAKEAAGLMGKSGALFGLQHRARLALRECLAQKGFGR